VFAAVLAALFGFLYVVLRMESMALLAGTIGLFALLSAVMMATRGMAGRER
jgi:inner membrane protein